MIKLFLYALFAIVTGLLATLFLAREPGYLLVSFADTSFETSLFALFVAIIAVLILLRLLLLIFAWINPLRLFSTGRKWSRSRVQRQANEGPDTERLLRDELYDELVTHLVAESHGARTVTELRKLWKQRTKRITPDDALISVYVDLLVHCDGISEAQKVLESALQLVASDMLVRQYSLLGLRLNNVGAAQQLQRAEAWLEVRPKDAQLLLALGRIALRNQLWGRARDYFERSLREQANTEVFAELARLLHNLKEQERSPQFLAAQTRMISQALPDFPQPN